MIATGSSVRISILLGQDKKEEASRVFSLFMPLCSIYFSTDNYLRDCGKVRLSMVINIVLLKLGGSTAVVAVVIAKKALKPIEA